GLLPPRPQYVHAGRAPGRDGLLSAHGDRALDVAGGNRPRDGGECVPCPGSRDGIDDAAAAGPVGRRAASPSAPIDSALPTPRQPADLKPPPLRFRSGVCRPRFSLSMEEDPCCFCCCFFWLPAHRRKRPRLWP